MLDPGLVARARRWGLFTSFSSFAFQFNKNVKKQSWQATCADVQAMWASTAVATMDASKYTMHRSKSIFTGSHGRCSFQITIEMSFERR